MAQRGLHLADAGRGVRRGAAPGAGRGHLVRGRARRALERLEDGALGDAVAPLEVRGIGVERGDRRELVGEVVEDDDEVRLDVARERHADGVPVRARDGRLEGGDRVVAEGADGAAGEAGHPVEGAQRG